MSDYPGAIDMLVDRSRVFQGAMKYPQSWYSIVIHKTACGGVCSAQDVANFFISDPKEASTHYVVGKDGTVVQCVREIDGAGGNCCLESGHDPFWNSSPTPSNINLCSFSIEHCDYSTDNSDTMPQEQIAASLQLVAYLVNKYNIPTTHIKGHNTISPISRKYCPNNYDWSMLYEYLGVATNLRNNWLTSLQVASSEGVPSSWLISEQQIADFVGYTSIGALVVVIVVIFLVVYIASS